MRYPGEGNLIAQPTDTALLAEAIDTAIRTPQAANQIYNVTNGEVAAMRDLWPAIAQCVGMEPGEVVPISFDQELTGKDAE